MNGRAVRRALNNFPLRIKHFIYTTSPESVEAGRECAMADTNNEVSLIEAIMKHGQDTRSSLSEASTSWLYMRLRQLEREAKQRAA